MKLSALLPFAALSSAFVIVDDSILNQVAVETKETSKTFLDKAPCKEKVVSYAEDTLEDVVTLSESALDKVLHAISGASTFQCHSSMTAFDVTSWLNTDMPSLENP